MHEEKFNAFIPIEIIEKADAKKDKDGLPEKLLIAGVASTPKYGYDKDGHKLYPSGIDFSPFLNKGFINLEHAYEKTKDASMIVGEPKNAFVKNDEFHIEGELYKDNPKGVAMYKLAMALKKAGSKRKIGYSIEGAIRAQDPNKPGDITKSVVTHCAITLSPKCDGTEMVLVKGGEKFEYELQNGSEFLVDITDDNIRYTVDKNFNIQKSECGDDDIHTQTKNTAAEKDRVTTKDGLGEGKKKKKRKEENYLTKGEAMHELLFEHNLDAESCKRVYHLACEIEKFIQVK